MTVPDPRWSEETLVTWLGVRFGLRAPALERVSAGNSRQVWIASDAAGPPRQSRLLVRAQFQPSIPAYSLSHEAAVYAALNSIGARVPTARGLSDDETVLVLDLLPGDTSLRGLSSEDQDRVVRDFLTCLGAVHSADPRDLFQDERLPGLTARADLRDCLAAELAIWEAAMRDSAARPSPLLELGLRWLRENAPEPAGGLALVQGDAGPGNFLHQAGTVTGIIDWEYAHVGDPLEDMAWILMRGVLDRIPSVSSLVREHCTATGLDDSPARLDYFLSLVLWKVLVIRHRMTGDLTRNVGRNLYYRLMHQRMFVEVMARNLGVPEPTANLEPDSPESGRGWLYDFGIQRVKEALPAIPDDEARSALASLVRVLRYLRAWDAGADWILGADPGLDGDKLAAHIRDGRLSCTDAFARVTPRLVREFALCADFLGPALARLAYTGTS